MVGFYFFIIFYSFSELLLTHRSESSIAASAFPHDTDSWLVSGRSVDQGRIGTASNFTSALETAESESKNVITINLHPVSAYTNYLESQLEMIDAEIQLYVSGIDNEEHNHTMRHLEEMKDSKSNQIIELHHERNLLQLELKNIIGLLKRSSPAYASVMEFPQKDNYDLKTITTLNGGYHKRHLKRMINRLQSYNQNIVQYNERYRTYSKFEWAERVSKMNLVDNGFKRHLKGGKIQKLRGHDFKRKRLKKENTASTYTATYIKNTNSIDFNSTLPIVQTTWQVIVMSSSLSSNSSDIILNTSEILSHNSTEVIKHHPALIDYPITLSIDSMKTILVSTMCNEYHGPLISLNSMQFKTGHLATSKNYCMEKNVIGLENRFTKALENRTFEYVIINSTTDNKMTKELLLWLPTIDNDRNARKKIVARFRSIAYKTFELFVEGNTTMARTQSALDLPGTNLSFSDSSADHDIFSIINAKWLATEMVSSSVSFDFELHPINEEYTITLHLDDYNRISVHAGCSGYSGDLLSFTNKMLIIGALSRTSINCEIRNSWSQEDTFINFLNGTSFFYNISRGKETELLLMKYSDGNERDISNYTLARFILLPIELDGNREYLSRGGFSIVSDRYSYDALLTNISSGTEMTNSRIRLTELTDQKSIQSSTDKRKREKSSFFNAYQTSPLHQGYGTHYATIWVGTPPQRKSVIIDTGSHFTAFPCKGCENCGEEHHTDKYFDPDASSTFRALTCTECQDAACQNGQCVFSQSYTEGSSWYAFEAVDKVFVGEKDRKDALSASNNPFKTDFLFGCQTKESGLFVTQLADGIMGMSAHPSTLPKVMYEQGKLEHNMFSICFKRELHVSKRGIVAGILTLGGVDTRADSTPMVYARNIAASGWYTVFVKNIYVRPEGGQSAKADGPNQSLQRLEVDLFEMNSGKGVIVDSGTTDTYLHKSLAEPFNKVWQRITGKIYSNSPVAMTQSDLLLLPTVLIQLAAFDDVPNPLLVNIDSTPGLAGEADPSSPHDVMLALPATHYMEYSPSKRTYTPRLYFTESKGAVIGANTMQGHNILFDWENRRVGFAESSCEYHRNDQQRADEIGTQVDCKLGNPTLSKSCSDSVDVSICDKNSNSDLTLNGYEVWTRLVNSPGTSQGNTCEQVSIAQNEINGGGNMEVQCDGKGVCRETRDCSFTCANIHAAGDYGGHPTKSGESAEICGEGTWSACDYTCSQTRINAILMREGKCHVEESLEFTRPCHIQACGRTDPCRVPFVIHAILKMRGSVASHWNKRAEEIFAEAFAATVNEKQKEQGVLFGPGDVQVLRASPWRVSDDAIFGGATLGDEDMELGMQLVVETSLSQNFISTTSCSDSDLGHLANVALDIHKELARPNFIPRLMKRIMNDEATDQLIKSHRSPFSNATVDRSLAEGSSVVTSWTIKTFLATDTTLKSKINSYTDSFAPVPLLLLSLGVVMGYVIWAFKIKCNIQSLGVSKTIEQHHPRKLNHRNRSEYFSVQSGGIKSNADEKTDKALFDDFHEILSIATGETDNVELKSQFSSNKSNLSHGWRSHSSARLDQ